MRGGRKERAQRQMDKLWKLDAYCDRDGAVRARPYNVHS